MLVKEILIWIRVGWGEKKLENSKCNFKFMRNGIKVKRRKVIYCCLENSE